MTPAACAPACPPGGPEEGNRARKKQQTRRDLHRAALEIALAEGPDAVTVDEIVARVGVSRRTFFNYYPSREAALAVADPEASTRIAARLAARPAQEPLWDSLRAVLLEETARLVSADYEWSLRRQVVRAHPSVAVSASAFNQQITTRLLAVAVERSGTDREGELVVAATVYAAMGAFRAAYWHHAEDGARGSLADRVRRAFDGIEGLGAPAGAATPLR